MAERTLSPVHFSHAEFRLDSGRRIAYLMHIGRDLYIVPLINSECAVLKNLFIVARELGTEFDARLKGLGLTSARMRVLLLLERSSGGMTQSSIADRLRVEPPTAVRILDGLEALGHIRRLPMPNDRRAKMVELTPSGEPLARQAGLVGDELERAMLDGLDPADVAATNRVLAALTAKIEALKSRGPSHAVTQGQRS